MKKVILLSAFFLVLTLQPAFTVDLADYGITVQSRRTEDGITVFRGTDNAGQRFDIMANKTISPREAESIVRIKDTLYSWRYMDISRLRISLIKDRIEANVVPSRITYSGTDLKPYLPSGMKFYIMDTIEYDYRMLVGDYAVKMRGQYFNEEQLLEKMKRAAENPVAYIQTTDPEYLFEQITFLSEEMEEMRSNAREIEEIAAKRWREFLDLRKNYQTLLESHRNLERSHRLLQDDYAVLRDDHTTLVERSEKAYRELAGELSYLTDKYNALREEHDALVKAHEELESSHTELALGVTTLRQAILMAANQGIFSTIGKTNVEGINSYVALRKENPDMTRDDAVAAVKEEELNISGKEALLADMIFLSEFDEKTK